MFRDAQYRRDTTQYAARVNSVNNHFVKRRGLPVHKLDWSVAKLQHLSNLVTSFNRDIGRSTFWELRLTTLINLVNLGNFENLGAKNLFVRYISSIEIKVILQKNSV